MLFFQVFNNTLLRLGFLHTFPFNKSFFLLYICRNFRPFQLLHNDIFPLPNLITIFFPLPKKSPTTKPDCSDPLILQWVFLFSQFWPIDVMYSLWRNMSGIIKTLVQRIFKIKKIFFEFRIFRGVIEV